MKYDEDILNVWVSDCNNIYMKRVEPGELYNTNTIPNEFYTLFIPFQ